MNVLSLFDGLSGGQFALRKADIKIDNYYSSEVEERPQWVAKYNFPNTHFIGDVRNIKASDLPTIDLIIGGSPCQSFSMAGKRNGMTTIDQLEVTTLEQYLELKKDNFEFEGQSYLFWEYVRLLRELKPKYFFLENVRMAKNWEDIISRAVGIQPHFFNSSLVSAQNRQRNYWTNINAKFDMFGEMLPGIEPPADKKIYLKDIIESGVVDSQIYSENENRSKKILDKIKQNSRNGNQKSITLTSSIYKGVGTDGMTMIPVDRCLQIGLTDNKKGFEQSKRIYSIGGKSPTLLTGSGEDKIPKIATNNLQWRKLTVKECERLQTLPDNATLYGINNKNEKVKISNSARYKMIGNGWTIDMIAHFFKNIKESKNEN